MGTVFLSHTRGGQPVALKVIRREYARDEEFRRRFQQEVTAARRVQGYHVVPVVDHDTTGDQPWLATSYVAGLPLDEALARYGALPLPAALQLVGCAAEALRAVHGAGVIHRDLKPSNVLLAANGPWVIDFGIARAAESTQITRSGGLIGTPQFMSPEHANGLDLTPATDVFSLGLIAAVAATGRHPYGQAGAITLAAKIANTAIRPPDLSDYPDALRPLLERCLVADPTARPAPAEIAELCERGAGRALRDFAGWLPGPLTAEIARREAAAQRPQQQPGGAAGATGAAGAAGAAGAVEAGAAGGAAGTGAAGGTGAGAAPSTVPDAPSAPPQPMTPPQPAGPPRPSVPPPPASTPQGAQSAAAAGQPVDPRVAQPRPVDPRTATPPSAYPAGAASSGAQSVRGAAGAPGTPGTGGTPGPSAATGTPQGTPPPYATGSSLPPYPAPTGPTPTGRSYDGRTDGGDGGPHATAYPSAYPSPGGGPTGDRPPYSPQPHGGGVTRKVLAVGGMVIALVLAVTLTYAFARQNGGDPAAKNGSGSSAGANAGTSSSGGAPTSTASSVDGGTTVQDGGGQDAGQESGGQDTGTAAPPAAAQPRLLFKDRRFVIRSPSFNSGTHVDLDKAVVDPNGEIGQTKGIEMEYQNWSGGSLRFLTVFGKSAGTSYQQCRDGVGADALPQEIFENDLDSDKYFTKGSVLCTVTSDGNLAMLRITDETPGDGSGFGESMPGYTTLLTLWQLPDAHTASPGSG
jgi:predicted Ser/Thr protein kinase